MQYANIDGFRRTAEPKLQATCEHCNNKVTAKCGSKIVWHWAHIAVENCDTWFEPETQWHRDWKNKFGKNCTEISIVKSGKKHIADVFTKDNLVIEFQNSTISSETIVEREEFYDKMIWVINGAHFKDNFKVLDKEFLDQWLPRTILVRKENLHISHPESRVLIIRGDMIKQVGVREILTKLKFVYNSQQDIYEYDLKNLYNEVALKTVIQDRVLELYNKSKVEQYLTPVYYTWPRARKSWQDAKKPVFIDLNDGYLIWIKSNIGNKEGSGIKVSIKNFLVKYNESRSFNQS